MSATLLILACLMNAPEEAKAAKPESAKTSAKTAVKKEAADKGEKAVAEPAKDTKKAEPAKAEVYYQSSLRVYPASPATHFGYGIWLYNNRRGAEAVSHLRYAVENGFNSSICYA
ncbi:MAG: hypothetical protein IAF94_21275, partial [Pirellulaceae bacterium]|nr:hypothetical protein [Pirellulaceae bacterium]